MLCVCVCVQTDADAGDDAVSTNEDKTCPKVVISKLSEATTRACGIFLERVRESRSRTRPDLVKHLVQMFDLKFLQELNPLTTGKDSCTLTNTDTSGAFVIAHL